VGRLRYGSSLRFEVAVQLNGLTADDLTVELVFDRPNERHIAKAKRFALGYVGALDGGEHLFARELTPEQCGKIEYRVRAFPQHELLTHPFELGMMVWL
jgi:starch phosphorylase